MYFQFTGIQNRASNFAKFSDGDKLPYMGILDLHWGFLYS